MASFASDITQFVKKTKLKRNVVLRKLGLDALRGVVLMSPVDTGRFRANWRVSLNRVELSSLPDADKGGEGTIQKAMPNFSGPQAAVWGDTIFISNNLIYAKRLEEGWSGQAPSGMLGVTFQRLRAQIAVLVKSVGG